MALLAAAGQLWVAGVEIKWPALHHDGAPRRVALPTYPFERKRYWIEPQRAVAGARPVATNTEILAGTSSSEVEALIDEQLRIMAKQIEVLRQAPANEKVRS